MSDVKVHQIGLIMTTNNGAMVPVGWRMTYAEAEAVCAKLNGDVRDHQPLRTFYAFPVNEQLSVACRYCEMTCCRCEVDDAG